MFEELMQIITGAVMALFGLGGVFGFGKMLRTDLSWVDVNNSDSQTRIGILSGDVMLLLISAISVVAGVWLVFLGAGGQP